MGAQVATTTAAACRVLPHVLAHIALRPKPPQLPLLRTLTLRLLRLTHHASAAATRAAAAACSAAAAAADAAPEEPAPALAAGTQPGICCRHSVLQCRRSAAAFASRCL